MIIREIVGLLDLKVHSGAKLLEREVTGGYVSDMLSDVMANGRKGDLWITLQVHQNIVAVATLKELAGIVIIGGKSPSADTVEKAGSEGILLFSTSLPAFEAAGMLYRAGLRGGG